MYRVVTNKQSATRAPRWLVGLRRCLSGTSFADQRGCGGLIVLGVCGSTFLRPSVNFPSQGGYEEEKWGYDELMANRNRQNSAFCG